MKTRAFRNVLFMIIVLIMSLSEPITITAGSSEQPKIIYLDLIGCEVCDTVKEYGVISGLKNDGIDVVVYDVMQDPLISDQYAYAYGISDGRAAPIIFAGDTYFRGDDEIITAYDAGDIYYHAHYPLRDITDYEPRDFSFLTGLFFIVIAGLLDGINPCAIAMLLMFISMIGFTKKPKVMIIVSIAYISAIFLTYLIIGFGFLTILSLSRQAFGNISFYLYMFFALLTLSLSILTFYDFLMSRKDRYEQVKNQLPKFIRKFNERIMTRFTNVLEDKHHQSGNILWLIVIPAMIGILVGITEAACTGQIYIAVLASLEASMTTGLTTVKLIYLVIFNIMFVSPLILIALIAIKSQSTVAIANFIREHLSIIKLLTAGFFIIMAVYFVLLALGIELITFDLSL